MLIPPNPSSSSLVDVLSVDRWLPDETIFSLCSRQHFLSGAALQQAVLDRFFIGLRAGMNHDVPAHLAMFIRATSGRFGTNPLDLCRDHSLVRLYLPWLSTECERVVIEAIANQGTQPARSLLGLTRGRFGTTHPLKLCRECVGADSSTYGTGYWHLQHQYPGVWWCEIHRRQLEVSALGRIKNGRYVWTLPRLSSLPRVPLMVVGSVGMRHLTETIAHSANLPSNFHFDYQRLKDTYTAKLADAGLMKSTDTVDRRQVSLQFLDHLLSMRDVQELTVTPGICHLIARRLDCLLYLACMTRHPLIHLLFIDWLFDGWPAFWSSYNTIPCHTGVPFRPLRSQVYEPHTSRH